MYAIMTCAIHFLSKTQCSSHYQPIIQPTFPENCMKMKKMWALISLITQHYFLGKSIGYLFMFPNGNLKNLTHDDYCICCE